MRLIKFLNELTFNTSADFHSNPPEKRKLNEKVVAYVRDFVSNKQLFTFIAYTPRASNPTEWELNFGITKNGETTLTSYQILRYYNYLKERAKNPEAKKKAINMQEWKSSLETWGGVLAVTKDFVNDPEIDITIFWVTSGDTGMIDQISKEFGPEEAKKARSLANFYKSSSFIRKAEKELNCTYNSSKDVYVLK